MALSEKQKQAIAVSAFVRTKQGQPNPFKVAAIASGVGIEGREDAFDIHRGGLPVHEGHSSLRPCQHRPRRRNLARVIAATVSPCSQFRV